MELVLKPAKAGCFGCYYDAEYPCPAMDEYCNLMKDRPCQIDGEEMIFVEEENEFRDSK